MIYICNSTQAKLSDSGCCADKDAEALRLAFLEKLNKIEGCEQEQVLFSNCMRNCIQGISVRFMPQNQLYGNVTIDDIDDLLKAIFIEKKPLKRLLIPPTNRFLGF